MAETCDDNPLLAGCTSSPPPLPSAGRNQPSPAVDLDDPRVAPLETASALLLARCGSCHGPADPSRCGTCDGLSNIDDISLMVLTGKIVPCRWRESRIYQRMLRAEMPPVRSGLPPMPLDEQGFIGDVVDGLCDDLSDGVRLQSERAAIEAWLVNDCAGCHLAGARDAGAAPPVPLDIATLVSERLLVPCDPGGSPLLQRLTDNSMPPPGSGAPRPTAAQLADLTRLIERPCLRR